MNDRFKFRSWDKEGKFMQYSDDIDPNYDIHCDEVYGDSWYRFSQALDCLDQKSLMQCTGLKDKNGKLIYEGDIISTGNDKQEDTWEISWGNILACWMASNWCSNSQLIGEHVPMFMDEEGNYPCEVIGNIYENPKLINN